MKWRKSNKNAETFVPREDFSDLTDDFSDLAEDVDLQRRRLSELAEMIGQICPHRWSKPESCNDPESYTRKCEICGCEEVMTRDAGLEELQKWHEAEADKLKEEINQRTQEQKKKEKK